MLCTNAINTYNTIRTQTGAAERKSSGQRDVIIAPYLCQLIFAAIEPKFPKGEGQFFWGASLSSVKSKGNIWQANDIFSTLG